MALPRIFLRMHISPFLWKWRTFSFSSHVSPWLNFYADILSPSQFSLRMVLRFQKILQNSLILFSLMPKTSFRFMREKVHSDFLRTFPPFSFLCVFPSLLLISISRQQIPRITYLLYSGKPFLPSIREWKWTLERQTHLCASVVGLFLPFKNLRELQNSKDSCTKGFGIKRWKVYQLLSLEKF